MSALPQLGIEGVGIWSPHCADWASAQSVLCNNVDIATNPEARPAATVLAPAERRRAPQAVLLALEVAQQACAMAGRDPRDLPNVFASAYGDLAINDYLCATLARAPLEVSPTRFHNSVHNAPAGYWAIATGCMQSSTAVSAGTNTFAASLLEAALLAHSENCAVLLVVCDVAAVGPLDEVIACRSRFGMALVLAPPSARAFARLRVQPRDATSALASEPLLLQACHRGNPAARSLPLLAALAQRAPRTLAVAAGPDMDLHMEITF